MGLWPGPIAKIAPRKKANIPYKNAFTIIILMCDIEDNTFSKADVRFFCVSFSVYTSILNMISTKLQNYILGENEGLGGGYCEKKLQRTSRFFLPKGERNSLGRKMKIRKQEKRGVGKDHK